MNQATDRIAQAFARAAESKRSALIPYVTSGDPSPAATVPLMHALVQAGADAIELGIPFSDPMADGPVIQRAAERAVAQGVGLPHVLDMVAEFRRDDAVTPIVFMGYANSIEAMGVQTFIDRAAAVGVDGVLVVDYPPEESVDFAAAAQAKGIAPIFLLAPTSTPARMRAIGEIARGYVYYVSLKGVTGAATLDTDDVARRLEEIRQYVNVPVGVGFGIRDAETASRVAKHADAVIIGSKLIETMEQAVAGRAGSDATDAAVAAAKQWLSGIRHALDGVRRG